MTRQGKKPFASPTMVRNLAGTVLAVGVAASSWGVAYENNGPTQTKVWVVADVHVRPGAVLHRQGPAISVR